MVINGATALGASAIAGLSYTCIHAVPLLFVLQNLQADTAQETKHASDNGGQHLYRTQLIAQPGSEATEPGGANNRHENLGPKS